MGDIEGPVSLLMNIWEIETSNKYWRIDNFIDEYFATINKINNKTV